jgi:hypothetical protein
MPVAAPATEPQEKSPLTESRCELCRLEKLTDWHYEDEEFVILDCYICEVPMAVLKRHDRTGTPEEAARMVAKARELFGADCWIDDVMRRIPDHKHFHVRWWRA